MKDSRITNMFNTAMYRHIENVAFVCHLPASCDMETIKIMHGGTTQNIQIMNCISELLQSGMKSRNIWVMDLVWVLYIYIYIHTSNSMSEYVD